MWLERDKEVMAGRLRCVYTRELRMHAWVCENWGRILVVGVLLVDTMVVVSIVVKAEK